MKLAIAGCMGRMGQTLMRYVAGAEGVTLVGGTCLPEQTEDARAFAKLEGLGELLLTESLSDILAQADGIIDFTTPSYSLAIAQECASQGKAHICGTTGFSEGEAEQFVAFGTAGAKIVHAPNMSICVNLFMKLTEQVASILDEEFDIEIVEMHHRFKADAPSGTALGIGKAAAKGRGVALDDVAEKVRDGVIGARKAGNIGFATLRGGDVVGDHTVTFAGMGERLELTHKASNRDIYARGATKAARWAQSQPAGYYHMTDVLGL